MNPDDRFVIHRALVTHDRELARVAITESNLLPEDAQLAIAKERDAAQRIRNDISNAMRAERLAKETPTT